MGNENSAWFFKSSRIVRSFLLLNTSSLGSQVHGKWDGVRKGQGDNNLGIIHTMYTFWYLVHQDVKSFARETHKYIHKVYNKFFIHQNTCIKTK